MSFTSILLRVDSSDGPYYLKAPAVGINEVSITSEIAAILPDCSPLAVTTSDELKCFVSKGFEHLELNASDSRDVILKLGRVQIESLQHLDRLKTAGCPVRNVDDLVTQMERWMTGDEVRKHYNLERLEQLIPAARAMCRQLQEFNIPQTLVHGDMGWNNATYCPPNSQEVLLFDWEFAHIGHPFCGWFASGT